MLQWEICFCCLTLERQSRMSFVLTENSEEQGKVTALPLGRLQLEFGNAQYTIAG